MAKTITRLYKQVSTTAIPKKLRRLRLKI